MSLGSMRDACLCSIAEDDGIHLHNRKQCLDAAQENYGDDDTCVDRFIEEERKANGDDQDKNQWAFELCREQRQRIGSPGSLQQVWTIDPHPPPGFRSGEASRSCIQTHVQFVQGHTPKQFYSIPVLHS